jgi:hypothetical protein
MAFRTESWSSYSGALRRWCGSAKITATRVSRQILSFSNPEKNGQSIPRIMTYKTALSVLHNNISNLQKSASRQGRAITNRILAPMGVQVIRISERPGVPHDWGDVTKYIPFAETVASAQQTGLPLGDYIDARQGIAGATQATINQMKTLGVFEMPIHAVVEIGPGSGRYLQATLRECSPDRCEVYETAVDWAVYLAKTLPVIAQPTDGASMRLTPSGSIDLVQAHKVFCATPFIVTMRYWYEMLRVTKPGSHIVFDVITENCLSPSEVAAWAQTGIPNRSSYPCTVPFDVVINFFAAHRAKLRGTFYSPMPPGRTEVFVFRTAGVGEPTH